MKKAAILTINDYNNYGNRLQNYAVQEILKKHGFQVETIVHELDYRALAEKYNKNGLTAKIQGFMKSNNKIEILKSKILKKQVSNPLLEERIANFKNFTKENITETDFVISESDIPKDLGSQYDYFFTGSDQVWNPNFRMGSAIDFLTFAPKEKRIALSASIGVSSIPEKFKKDYKIYLEGMHAISVREHQGAKLIKELSGRDTEVLIDPTLYLSKEEWLQISKPHKNKPSKDYLLTYFLGEIADDYRQFINEYARKENLEVVNLADAKIEKFYIADPANFIDYIHSAHTFFTDSYHGIIFSILLQTRFLIFDRVDKTTAKMNSRMETLQKNLKISSESFYSSVNSNPILCDINIYEQIRLNKRQELSTFLKKHTIN